MKRLFVSKLLLGCLVFAGVFAQAQDLTQAEQENLSRALSEAGNSPLEFARAIENHLKQYPDSPKKAELLRALVKTAIDLNDDRRIGQYGEMVLQLEPDNLQTLERVTTALLHKGDKASLERALEHAQHFQHVVEDLYRADKFTPGAGFNEGRRRDDFDRGLARSRIIVARCQGLLGHTAEAIQLAQASYAVFPSIEAARESAKWLMAAGKDQDALPWLATAIAISGIRSSDGEELADRTRLTDTYRKLHNGSEAGLGDIMLKAYETTAAQFTARRARLREIDPNIQVKDPLQFVLSGVDGDKLQLSSLAGKVVVMDFWATWCGPCRQQHPLYDEVKAKFKDRDDVVFLAIATDEDHSLVKPFLETQKWTQRVYFDDGLQNLLQVSSIPMTLVFSKKGEMISRMPGFLPDRFVAMLADRIDEALGVPRESQKPKAASSQ